jgi:hypothetical protein
MRAEVEEALRPDIEKEIRESIEAEAPRKKKSIKKSKKIVVIDEDVPLEDNALPDAEPEVAGQEVEEQGVAPQGKGKGKAKAKTTAKTKAKATSVATSKAPAKKKSSQKVMTGRVTKNKGKKAVTKRVAQLLESVASEGEEATIQESGQGEKAGASIPENDPALPVKNGPISAPVAGEIIPEEQNAVLEEGGENHDSPEDASDKSASNEAVVSREGSTEQQDVSEGEDPDEDILAKMAREALEKQERAERERERAFFLSTQDNTIEDEADDYNDTSNYFDGEDDDEEGDPDDYI